MKKLIPILAVFLILSTLLVSCGKIEKYHDSPQEVYLAVPYVDPAEWRNYRYLKEELGTIELDSDTLLYRDEKSKRQCPETDQTERNESVQ